MKLSVVRAALPGLLLWIASAGYGQAEPIPSCVLPHDLAPVAAEPPPAAEVQAAIPVASYVLSLSWAPEYCRSHGQDPNAAMECRDNAFGFIVHGLWPNGAGQVHPRFCHPPSSVDVATLKASLCMTPSAHLLQHEWAAHGTCGWPSPAAYFAKARALRAALNAPRLAPGPGGEMTAGQVRAAFIAQNRNLKRSELYIQVGPDRRFQEVHVCYDLHFAPASCVGGHGADDAEAVRIAPMKGD
ncbi:MAG TPA: ribonuclease T [Caulobacteraceae bacterium]|jgi:ribonuclease T2|nr:ribonuclease T [Caulobacteraceae bacterium]